MNSSPNPFLAYSTPTPSTPTRPARRSRKGLRLTGLLIALVGTLVTGQAAMACASGGGGGGHDTEHHTASCGASDRNDEGCPTATPKPKTSEPSCGASDRSDEGCPTATPKPKTSEPACGTEEKGSATATDGDGHPCPKATEKPTATPAPTATPTATPSPMSGVQAVTTTVKTSPPTTAARVSVPVTGAQVPLGGGLLLMLFGLGVVAVGRLRDGLKLIPLGKTAAPVTTMKINTGAARSIRPRIER